MATLIFHHEGILCSALWQSMCEKLEAGQMFSASHHSTNVHNIEVCVRSHHRAQCLRHSRVSPLTHTWSYSEQGSSIYCWI